MNTVCKTINTVEAKNRFNAIVEELVQSKSPVIVAKRGKPVAVIVDFESYQKPLNRSSQKSIYPPLQQLKAIHRRQAQECPQGLREDSVEILRQLRLERSK